MSLISSIIKLPAAKLSKRLFTKFAPQGGLGRAALALGGVTLIGQGVGVLLSPVYSRLYTPADYGVFSVFSAIIATALTVGSLCYETGVPIAKDDSEAIGLTALAMFVLVLIGMGSVAWLGFGALFQLGGTGSRLGSFLWLVPVGIVGAGLYGIVKNWALRGKAIGAIARASILQVVGANTINLGFGILGSSPLGLILAGIAGNSVGLWGLARRTKLLPRLQSEREKRLTFGNLWILAKQYKRLPLIQAPSTLFNSLGLNLPGLLAAPYFGVDFAGQFFMGLRMILFPAGLIGGAIYQVFFSSAAALAREQPQHLSRFFNRVFIRGATCSLLILFVGLMSPWVIPFALGEKWREAGEIAFWLSLCTVFGLSVSPLSCIPSVVGRFRGQLVIDVMRATAVFLLFYLSHRLGLSGMALVKGYTSVMILNYVACYFLYRHQVKQVSFSGLTGWSKPAAAP